MVACKRGLGSGPLSFYTDDTNLMHELHELGPLITRIIIADFIGLNDFADSTLSACEVLALAGNYQH
jgi:hypothetical protein